MVKWLLTASIDAIDINFETIIDSEGEPGFWECYDLARAAGCEWFCVDRLEEDYL